MIARPSFASTVVTDAAGAETKTWAVHLAVGASLMTLVDNRFAALWQLVLFGGAVLLNSAFLARLLTGALRPAQVVYVLMTLPIFLRLEDAARMDEEWLLTRIIFTLLFGGVYVLPFLPCSSTRDLRRITLVLAACFFYSASFFHASWFFPALIVTALAMLIAFNSLQPATSGTGHARSVFRLAGFHLLLAVLGGAAVFYGFPRTWFRDPWNTRRFGDRDMVSQPLGNSQLMAQAGLSSRRDLLQLAHLLDFSRSSTEVLKIRLTLDATGEPFYATNSLYLRASVFETYANGSWISRQPFLFCRDDDDGKHDGWTWVQSGFRPDSGLRIRQSIQMEPLDDVCPCLPNPLAISQPLVKFERRGILMLPYKAVVPWSCTVISELPMPGDHPSLDEPSRQSLPVELSPYLEIPPTLRPLLNLYKSHWELGRSPARQVELIRQFLQNQFEYGSVPFTPTEDADPVRNFLTESRRGYCSHFASALALMARSIGLPSRVATGLHFIGRPDPDGLYHLRDLNAHAWTEIYFPGHGWILFDATPPAFRPSAEKLADPRSWWQTLLKLKQVQNLLDGFDATDQKAILLWLKQATRFLATGWKRLPAAPWLVLSLVLTGSLVWAVFRRLPLRHRRRVLQRLTGRTVTCSVPFYEDLLWILSRRGFSKPPGCTGLEYANSVSRQYPGPEIGQLTRHFYRVKYGGQNLSPEEQREIRHHLDRLESSLR